MPLTKLQSQTIDTNINVVGIITAATISASQTLQVTGGGYVSGNLGIGTTNPTGILNLRGYTGGTGGSIVSTYNKTFVIGGVYNQSYNTGNSVLMHIADYSNDAGDNVYPIYCEDENNIVDFWINAGNSESPSTKKAYFGGSVGIGTTNPTSSLQIGNTTSTSLTNSAIWLNGATGSINLDDNGQKRISWNDGSGNLNIRAGNYNNGTTLVYAKGTTDSNGGAASITLSNDGVDGSISLNVAAIGTPGNAVTFTNTFQLYPTYTTTNVNFTSTQANSTTTGGGQIYLNGATGNRIDFNINGVNAPAFTTRSVGTKLVLYPAIAASSADYAFGIENSTLWSSVPTTSQQFKWYGGTTLAATLSGAGALTLVGGLSANGISTFVSSGGNQLLLHTGGNVPTVIHRNDGSDYYTLLSAAGTTPSGTWNALRPLSINLSTGLLSSSNGQSFGGGTSTTTLSASSDINLAGELNFTGANNKYIDFYTDNDAGALSTAHLRLVNNANTSFHSAIHMTRGGAVTLYHNNSEKLATSSTGVSITGTISVTSTNQAANLNAAFAGAAAGGSFFTQPAGSEGQIGCSLSGYNPVYMFNNAIEWGIYSASGGTAFRYLRSTGVFQFNGNCTGSASYATNAGTVGGFTPVQQGGGSGQGTNKLYIGWLGSKLGLQVDSTNFGDVWPINTEGTFKMGAFDFSASTTTQRTIGQGGNIFVCNTAAQDSEHNISVQRTNTGSGIRFLYQSTQVGRININTTTTTYVTSSDYRLKENIVPIEGAIERLMKLKPSRFNFIIEPDITVDGFIAHEAAEVVPESVTGTKDAVDKEGEPVYQGIDTGKLVPLLTAALKEAIEEIKIIKKELNELKNK